MSESLQRTWTRDEFLDWVERQEEQSEFDGMEPVATDGGPFNRNLIAAHIQCAPWEALQDALSVVPGQRLGVVADSDGVQLLTRGDRAAAWTATSLTLGDTLGLRGAGMPASLPVAAVHAGVAFDG